MMILQVLLLLVGFLLLVKGADWFVEGAASIAKKMGKIIAPDELEKNLSEMFAINMKK